ncbi:MAG: GNAT family N-acetyltransferase, partial [Caldilineaceae bacterium]
WYLNPSSCAACQSGRIVHMLRGERVTLRAISREDIPRLWSFNNSLEIELAGGGDPPIPQSLARFEADFEQAVSKGGRDGSAFVIEADSQCIGQCALFNASEAARSCELGITIGDPIYLGKGYGREAISLLLQYAFRYRNYRKVWLEVNDSNARAIGAYRACGFVEEGRLRAHVWSDGAYQDLILMGILRSDWGGGGE